MQRIFHEGLRSSGPHLGSILAPFWPLLASLLAALGPILALGSLLANWSAFLNPGFRPPLPQVRSLRALSILEVLYRALEALVGR